MKKISLLLALILVLSITLSSCKNADMNIPPNISSGDLQNKSQQASSEIEHDNEQYDLLMEECKNTFDSVIISEKFRKFNLLDNNKEDNLRKAGLIFDKDTRITTKDVIPSTYDGKSALNIGNVLNINYIYRKTFISDCEEGKINKDYFLNAQDKLNIFPVNNHTYDEYPFYFPYFFMENDNKVLCGDSATYLFTDYSKAHLTDFPDSKQSTIFNYFADDFYDALEKEVGTIKNLNLTLLAGFNKDEYITVEHGYSDLGLLLLIESDKGFFVTLMTPAYSDYLIGEKLEEIKVFIDCLGRLYYTDNTKPQIGKNIWKPEEFAKIFLKADEEFQEFIKTYSPPCG